MITLDFQLSIILNDFEYSDLCQFFMIVTVGFLIRNQPKYGKRNIKHFPPFSYFLNADRVVNWSGH